MDRDRLSALVKTAIFTVAVPTTVVLWLPWLLGIVRLTSHGTFAMRFIGLTALASGALIYLFCAFSFAWTGRGTPSPTHSTRTLVVGGLYRYCRNPMYWGLLLALVGEFILFGRSLSFSAIYFAIFLVAVNLFVRFYEEPTLKQKFGADYEEYFRKVPRWIPRKI
jgi:protein-S-isoprenylcysteine O-methyltransferase Ste14